MCRDRSYSLAEMKAFKKMAKAIRNVNEREGHCEATAAFVDSEFSDNSGIVVKALRSNNAWKKLRVNAICDKAAKIMEDRCVYRAASYTRVHRSCYPCTGFAYIRKETAYLMLSCNASCNVSIVA